MKLRVLLLLGSAAWFAPAQQPACRSVGGDRILARDLAAALPEFGVVPPETLLAPAPVPGSQRVFHSTELLALARRYGIALPAAPDTCFQWAMEPLDRAAALAAMREALRIPAAPGCYHQFVKMYLPYSASAFGCSSSVHLLSK